MIQRGLDRYALVRLPKWGLSDRRRRPNPFGGAPFVVLDIIGAPMVVEGSIVVGGPVARAFDSGPR
jgi:hypothetical protein